MKDTVNAAEQPIETGLTVSQTIDQGVSTQQEPAYKSVDLTQPLPDLDTAAPIPIDLMSNYWSPVNSGESKRVFFVKLASSLVKAADDTGELIPLECAYFLEKVDGEIRQIRNGSKRLVGTLSDAIGQGILRQGVPLLITYNGKTRNKTNSFVSDNWSVKVLQIDL